MMIIRARPPTLRVLVITLISILLWQVWIGSAQDHLSLAATFAHEGVCVTAFSPDSSHLAVRSTDGIHLYQTSAITEPPQFIPGQFACQLMFTPNGQQIAAIAGTTVQLLNVQNGEVIQAFAGHRNSVTSLALSSDGKLLASSGRDYRTVIWDIRTGEELYSFEQGKPGEPVIYPAMSLDFSPDGSRLAAATRHTIHVWNTQSGEWVAKLSGGVSPGLVRFNSDGTRLMMASTINARFVLWNTSTWNIVVEGMLSSGQQGISFSPGGQFVALGTSGENDTHASRVQILDAITGQQITMLPLGEEWPPSSLAYSPDGSILAVGSYDGSRLMLWDPTTGDILASHEAHGARIGDISFSPDGAWLVTMGYDDLVRVWAR